jgi:gas vesicle protein
MPQAKKSTRSRSSSSARGASRTPAFKEPAALKRLNKSLESAQDALGDLRKDLGRDTGVAARDLQKQLRTAVTGSRRDIGKLVKALQRDFDRAQSKLTQGGARSTTRARSARGRSASSRGTSSRAKSTRSTSTRSTRSGASRARSSK